MARKPKTPQKENINEVDGRDAFQTPNYATEILVPFLQDIIAPLSVRIWECAAGLGKMANYLIKREFTFFEVTSTDLLYDPPNKLNFLTENPSFSFDCIVTNPPFSLKRKFFLKCLEYQKPFALLIPADYSGWLIEAVDKYGCEKIIPTRRVDYITPDILKRIHEGEVFEILKRKWKEEGTPGLRLEAYKEFYPGSWAAYLNCYLNIHNYKSIYDVPSSLLRKYSSCQFYSMWLTWGFNIGRTETFVELTNEQKNNI